jgi:hypothetical protein
MIVSAVISNGVDPLPDPLPVLWQPSLATLLPLLPLFGYAGLVAGAVVGLGQGWMLEQIAHNQIEGFLSIRWLLASALGGVVLMLLAAAPMLYQDGIQGSGCRPTLPGLNLPPPLIGAVLGGCYGVLTAIPFWREIGNAQPLVMSNWRRAVPLSLSGIALVSALALPLYDDTMWTTGPGSYDVERIPLAAGVWEPVSPREDWPSAPDQPPRSKFDPPWPNLRVQSSDDSVYTLVQAAVGIDEFPVLVPHLQHQDAGGQTLADVVLAQRYSREDWFLAPERLVPAADGHVYVLFRGPPAANRQFRYAESGPYVVELDALLRPVRRWITPGPPAVTNATSLLLTDDGTLYLRNDGTYRLIPG